jgi:hypothetical protein
MIITNENDPHTPRGREIRQHNFRNAYSWFAITVTDVINQLNLHTFTSFLWEREF